MLRKLVVLLAVSVIIAACAPASAFPSVTPVVASTLYPLLTATPTPEKTPVPEAEDLRSYTGVPVQFAIEVCKNLPRWFQNPNWGRGLYFDAYSTGSNEIATDKFKVTYVVFGQVYINDRIVEFRPERTEVFQIFEDHITYELYPDPFIERAMEILDGNVEPVEIIATWIWLKDESGQYDFEYWHWDVTSATCTRLN